METKKILSQFEFKNALFGYGVQMQALSQCPTSKDIHDEAERLQFQLLEDDQLLRDRITALEAERDEWAGIAGSNAGETELVKRNLEDAEGRYDACYAELTNTQAELAALRLRLEEAEDTKLLNKLDVMPIIERITAKFIQEDGNYLTWTVKRFWGKEVTGRTIREALRKLDAT